MKSCSEFEIAVEMKRHGALDAAGALELERHLDGCASCRAFESISRESERHMAEEALRQAQETDWQGLKERIRERLSGEQLKRLKRMGLFFLIGTPLVALTGTGVPWVHALQFAGVAAAGLAVAWGVSRWRLRELRRYEESRADLLFFYRRALERRLWVARRSLVAVGVYAALVAWHWRSSPTFPAFGRHEAHGAVLIGLALVGALYSFFVRRRELERELQLLKRS